MLGPGLPNLVHPMPLANLSPDGIQNLSMMAHSPVTAQTRKFLYI